MNDFPVLEPEVAELLRVLRRAEIQLPREQRRAFHFYDLQPVTVSAPQIAGSGTGHSLGHTDFNTQGLARVSVHVAMHLTSAPKLRETFTVISAAEARRVEAFRGALDSFQDLETQLEAGEVSGVIFHPGLSQGRLCVAPDDVNELRDLQLVQFEDEITLRLTAQARQLLSSPNFSASTPLMNTNLTPPVQPRVFISHSSQDKSFVQRLATDLKAASIAVWVDMVELQVGDSIVGRINQGLKETDYLVVVLSKAALQSQWVQAELSAGIMSQFSDRGITVLPVRLEPVELPPLLSDRLYADFSRNYDEGLRQLLEVLRRDLTTIEALLSQVSATSLQTPPSNLTSCVEQLAKEDEGTLRNQLRKRMNHSEVRDLWRNTLGGDMLDEVPGRSVGESLLELFIRAEKQNRTERLLQNICKFDQDFANSHTPNP